MALVGWYYLHTNGSLIFKQGADQAADIRDSDFARALWPCDPTDRATAWATLVEAWAAGAHAVRIRDLATQWACDDADAAHYAKRIGVILSCDGNQFCATKGDFANLQESPAGFGDTALEAFVALCKALGYKPAKMWGAGFADLVKT